MIKNNASITIEGKHEDINRVSYDTHSIDSKKQKGPKRYKLEIGIDYFEEQLKSIYESNLKDLIQSQFLQRKISFHDWINNEGLLKKICLDWFGYAVLDPFLRDSRDIKFILRSLDDVKKVENKIILSGTVSEKTILDE